MNTENMSEKQMLADMKQAKCAYEAAKLSGIGVARAKERMMNTAFNYYDMLVSAVEQREALQEENAMLLDSLDRADEEAKARNESAKPKRKGRSESHGIGQAGNP